VVLALFHVSDRFILLWVIEWKVFLVSVRGRRGEGDEVFEPSYSFIKNRGHGYSAKVATTGSRTHLLVSMRDYHVIVSGKPPRFLHLSAVDWHYGPRKLLFSHIERQYPLMDLDSFSV